MIPLNNIEIVILIAIWFVLNLSLVLDWIAERRERTPGASR